MRKAMTPKFKFGDKVRYVKFIEEPGIFLRKINLPINYLHEMCEVAFTSKCGSSIHEIRIEDLKKGWKRK